MSERSKWDIDNFDAQSVIEEIRKDAETKGSLDITGLANKAAEGNEFLSALGEAVGSAPFSYVLKSNYEDRIAELRVQLNPELILASLPEQFVGKVRGAAAKIRRESVSAKNPEFMALKYLICAELVKAILVKTNGSVVLTWDENRGTDLKFTHAHTSDAKKAAIEEQREARAERQTGGNRVSAMREKFRRGRG